MKHFLTQNRAAILSRWQRLIMETYPANTAKVLRQQKDRFANPVGYTIAQETAALYDGLLQEWDGDSLSSALNNIVRIRAVQDFPPSQAISFVFLLKRAIREELGGDLGKAVDYDSLSELEASIDRMALLALDIYLNCREQVFEISLNEVKKDRERAFRILERASLIQEDTDSGPLPGEESENDET